MPPNNAFRHQEYRPDAPTTECEFLHPEPPAELDSAAFREQLAVAGETLAAANVACIYLIHGTLAGTDMSGLIGELGRLLPEWSHGLKQQRKRLLDTIAGDWGNYDQTFADTLYEGVNARLETPIAVERFLWSSENHHMGRADAAVQLIHDLHSKSFATGQRVMLWGHSHGGNVLALMTNLLGGTLRSRAAFFKSARPFYRSRSRRVIDLPVWGQVRHLLSHSDNPLANICLDLTTFGTPVRYGWESGGYQNLVHFINHRPTDDWPLHLVPFPPTLEQIQSASAGDFFQQFFIAGTNFPPALIAWRSWRAERRLRRLVQAGHNRRDLWTRLKAGMRVPDEGITLLVDYSTGDPETARSMAGHSVYTKQQWLPFHLESVIASCY